MLLVALLGLCRFLLGGLCHLLEVKIDLRDLDKYQIAKRNNARMREENGTEPQPVKPDDIQAVAIGDTQSL